MSEAPLFVCPKLKDGFTRVEKMLLQAGIFVLAATGAAAIFPENPLAGWFYLGFAAAGLFLTAVYFLCARCPYPYDYKDCLFFPYRVVIRFIRRRPGKQTGADRVGTLVVMMGLILIPQYWLFQDLRLLFVFWLIGIPFLAAFPMYYCKRCRHFGCVFNRVERPVSED